MAMPDEVPSQRLHHELAQTASHDAPQAHPLLTLGALTAGITNDFAHALDVIVGNGTLAQRRLEREHPARPFVDELATHAAHAQDLVQRLQAYRRADGSSDCSAGCGGDAPTALTGLGSRAAEPRVSAVVADTLALLHEGAPRQPSSRPAMFDELGLELVRGLLKPFGGSVTMSCEPGAGTTLRLYFPTANSAREPTALPDEHAGGRILFVDDDAMLVTLGTQLLEVLGYEVYGCSEPLEALRICADSPRAFDAVVTDLSMPGLSGFQLTQQLHALRRDLPVVMMSGYVGPDELSQARKSGVRELLIKPLGMDDLRRCLTRVLSASRRHGAAGTRVHKS